MPVIRSRLRLEKRHSEQAANRIAVSLEQGRLAKQRNRAPGSSTALAYFGRIYLGRLKLMVTCV